MSHRYRLYPTTDQQDGLDRHCDDARFVWNLAVAQLEHCLRYRRHRTAWPSARERSAQLTEARNDTWLGEGNAAIQQQALRDFEQAMRNWWSNPAHFGRPTWRSKRRGSYGFAMAANARFAIRPVDRRWAELRVPTVGWVRFRTHRNMVDCKSVRVTRDRAGRWWVSLVAVPVPIAREQTGAVVGVDRGVANTITTSEGEFEQAPGLTAGEARRRLRLQRKLARQRNGSNRRAATKAKLARLSAREVDRRNDWVEKSTTRLVRNYDVIAVEDLRVKNMVRSARGTVDAPGRNVAQKAGLNRAIHAQAWGRWLTRLEQKASLAGVEVVRVPPRNTSRRCHTCGYTAPENRESQAVFRCGACGHEDHADVNAAKNILAAGLAVSGRGGPLRAGEASTGRSPLRAA